jgi:hypothetical protein
LKEDDLVTKLALCVWLVKPRVLLIEWFSDSAGAAAATAVAEEEEELAGALVKELVEEEEEGKELEEERGNGRGEATACSLMSSLGRFTSC